MTCLLLAGACGSSDSRTPDAGPVRCTAHDQCASGACLPDGTCADGSNVAFVDPRGSDNPQCTQAMPCSTLSSALAKQPYIKVTGVITDNVTFVDRTVTIMGDRGAKLTSGGVGNVITILGNAQVSIFDLEISGATGEIGDGIQVHALEGSVVTLRRVTVSDNGGFGIDVVGSTVIIAQSTIRNNASGGAAVTLDAPATAEIANNFIYHNGSKTSGTGALFVRIRGAPMAVNHVEFNTMVDNQSAGFNGRSAGVQCFGGVNASNNLIFRNKSVALQVDPQIDGNCNSGSSLLMEPNTPGFSANYHLTDLTPFSIRDAADCTSAIDTDFDGDPRPLGARCDLGADEYRP